MNARSSTAFVASLLIHGLFVAVMLLTAWVFRSETVNTKIMELVQGDGDNYDATEAPAGGNPDSANTTNSPIDTPVQQMEAVAAPQPRPAAPPVPTVPDFSRRLERIADHHETRRMKRLEQQQKAREEAERKAAEAARKKEEAERKKEEAALEKAEKAVAQNKMTKEEFDRRFPKKTPNARTSTSTIKTEKIDTKGIAGGVRDGSRSNDKGGAGGTALQRDPDADRLDAYFSMLIQRLKNAHERPAGVSDLLTARAEFYITPDGEIFNVSIIRSSGNPEFDQSVLSAFRNVGSIGPRPDTGGTLRKEVTFRMRDE
jgi:colicin import membrane protein